jgi:hypothetical protein
MERNVRSKTYEANDPEHPGVLRLVADDRLLHLVRADLEADAHPKTESGAAFAKP